VAAGVSHARILELNHDPLRHLRNCCSWQTSENHQKRAADWGESALRRFNWRMTNPCAHRSRPPHAGPCPATSAPASTAWTGFQLCGRKRGSQNRCLAYREGLRKSEQECSNGLSSGNGVGFTNPVGRERRLVEVPPRSSHRRIPRAWSPNIPIGKCRTRTKCLNLGHYRCGVPGISRTWLAICDDISPACGS
jgi:hypothetical protein